MEDSEDILSSLELSNLEEEKSSQRLEDNSKSDDIENMESTSEDFDISVEESEELASLDFDNAGETDSDSDSDSDEELAILNFDDEESDEEPQGIIQELLDIDDIEEVDILETEDVVFQAVAPAITLKNQVGKYTNIIPSLDKEDIILKRSFNTINNIRNNIYDINENALYQNREESNFPADLDLIITDDIPESTEDMKSGILRSLGIISKQFETSPGDELSIPKNISLNKINQLDIVKLPKSNVVRNKVYSPKVRDIVDNNNIIIRVPTTTNILESTEKLSDIDIDKASNLLNPSDKSRRKIYTLTKINIKRVSTKKMQNIKMYNVSELKEFLKELDVQSSGQKNDLVERLRREYNQYMR